MDIFAKPAPGEDETKLMGEYDSASNCASAIAHSLLSMHRVGTKFSTLHDETHSCNAEPRVNELVQQLKLLAHNGEERVAQAYKDEVARLGYTEDHMLRMTQQRNILDAARHCRLGHVRHSPTTSQVPSVLTDNKAAADLIVLTTTKPLTAHVGGNALLRQRL